MPPRIGRAADSRERFFVEGCYITEWWNTPDDPGLSIARARVPAGATTRWHRLSGIAERYLILEGRGRVEVEGLPATEVGPGDTVLIPPGTAQRVTSTGTGELVFLALCTPRFRRACYLDLHDPAF